MDDIVDLDKEETESEEKESEEIEDPFEPINNNNNIRAELIEEKYDIDRISKMLQFHRSFVFCGPTASGKTSVMKNVLKNYIKLFDMVIVFSGSYFEFEFLDCGIPKEYHKPINEVKIRAVIEALTKIKDSGNVVNTLLVFDDTTGNLDLAHSKLMDRIVTQCRHFNCSTFFSCHWLSKLSRTILESANFFFVLNSSREALSRIQQYTNFTEKELWEMYTSNSTVEFSFMFFQKIKPNKKMIYFCNPIKNISNKASGIIN